MGKRDSGSNIPARYKKMIELIAKIIMRILKFRNEEANFANVEKWVVKIVTSSEASSVQGKTNFLAFFNTEKLTVDTQNKMVELSKSYQIKSVNAIVDLAEIIIRIFSLHHESLDSNKVIDWVRIIVKDPPRWRIVGHWKIAEGAKEALEEMTWNEFISQICQRVKQRAEQVRRKSPIPARKQKL